MRRIVQYLALSFAIALFAVPMYSQTCPTPPSFQTFYPCYWDDYSPEPACIVASGSVGTTTTSCWLSDEYEYFDGMISYTFTVEPTVEGESYSYMEATTYVDFDDPYDDWNNYIEMRAIVTSNGVSTTHYLFYHDGLTVDLSCHKATGTFSVKNGDTVEIQIIGKNSTAYKIASTRMYILGVYFC